MTFEKIFKKKPPFIIAEVGNNHEGNFQTALKYIDEAAKVKADGVKFQTFKTQNFYNKSFTDKKRFKILKKYQLSYDQFFKLSKYAKRKKIIFFSTPLDLESAIFLNKIQPLFKIASGDNNFFQLMKLIKSFNKPTIISTGIINHKEIIKITKIFKSYENKLALLHCVSKYPTNDVDLNLNSIKYLNEKFRKHTIGFSDHSIGIDNCKVALTLGAKIIEKHFTLSKNKKTFRDHALSADKHEIKNLVEYANRYEKILGNYKKSANINELKNIRSLRRSAYLKNDLIKKQKLQEKDIIWQRPYMFNQKNIKKCFGKAAKSYLKKGSPIFKKDFK